MNAIRIKKHIRILTVKAGIFRPLRSLVFWMRGSRYLQCESDFHRRLINAGQLVFDVGANRGQSSEVFLSLGARVIAFEPQMELHGEIRQVCRHNPNLTIEGLGLGAVEETRRFFITAYDQVASLRDDWEGERIGEEVIQVSTLDRQIARHGLPSYCKIDVEGWELPVLQGLSQAIPIISFEYHTSSDEILQATSVLERLSKLGRYYCNFKESSGLDFALSNFISIDQFIADFSRHLSNGLKDGYGDIFCTLDPKLIRMIASHD
jgi:FkbM family methyltransferase